MCSYKTFMTSSCRYKGSFVPMKILWPHHFGIRGVLYQYNFHDLIILVYGEFCAYETFMTSSFRYRGSFFAYETFMTSSFRYKGSFVPIQLSWPHHFGIRGVLCLRNLWPHHFGIRGVLCLWNFYDLIMSV